MNRYIYIIYCICSCVTIAMGENGTCICLCVPLAMNDTFIVFHSALEYDMIES